MNELEQPQVPIEAAQQIADALGNEPEPAPAESPFQENLASGLQKEEVEKIGRKTVEDYRADLDSLTDWHKKRANWLKLFAGTRDPKNFPWEHCSNVHLPIMGVACIQFQARTYEALLPSKEFAKCWSTDGKTKEQANRAQKYLNYQLMEQMEEWEEDMDILLLLLPINGSGYKKTYYDFNLKRPVSITIPVEHFVTPYRVKRIEDAPRKTHSYYESLNNLKIKGRDGIFINTEDLKESDDYKNHPSTEIKEQADKIVGQTEPVSIGSGMRLLLEQHRTWDLDNDGIEEDYIVTVDFETEKVLRIESNVYTDPIDNKEKVASYFTCYTFIPNPDSHYGFGFGHLLEGINESADSIMNQLIDAGTLSNTQSGLINRRSGLKSGEIKLAPGVFKEVDISGDDIRKAIFTLTFKEPSTALFNLLGLLQNSGKEISSVTESMMGKLPPSDTTATTMLAVMEQGLKVFSTIHKRIHRSFKKELQKIYRLNSLYLDEHIYFVVQDSTSGDMTGYTSGKNDFVNNIDVMPISDPTITSRAEKLIKARQAYEIGIGNPLVSNNPEAMYELTKAFYEAIEVQNVDKIVKKPQPQAPPDLNPLEEESLWLQERYIEPLQHQDHVAHLTSHQVFANSEWASSLTPQGKKVMDMHMKATMSMLYMQKKQLDLESMQLQSQMGAMNEQGQAGMEGMVEPSTYARMVGKIGPKEAVA